MIDIFITYKDRYDLFKQSFSSFIENTPKDLYRLTIVCDGFTVPDFIQKSEEVDYVLHNRSNMGLGPSMNMAHAHIKTLDKWNSSSPLKEDNEKATNFICYLQDDILYSESWLEKLIRALCFYEAKKNINFASGIECIEHDIKEELGNFLGQKVLLKSWIRATCMLARVEIWNEMMPIPPLDPETGRKRAKPNDGMGSGVDWHLIRNHPFTNGKNALVLPGLLQHIGYTQSTWLNREMPESDEDKKSIALTNLDELTRLTQEMGLYDYDREK